MNQTCSGNQKNLFFFVNIVFGKKLSGNAVSKPLWLLIQGWEQGQQSHYIQPSNLSSALEHIL